MSPKDITTIDTGSNELVMFEGFFDFLRYLSLRETFPRLFTGLPGNSNFLVMNSLSSLGKSLSVIDRHDQIHLFLDNDPAGRAVTEQLLAANKCNSYYLI